VTRIKNAKTFDIYGLLFGITSAVARISVMIVGVGLGVVVSDWGQGWVIKDKVSVIVKVKLRS